MNGGNSDNIDNGNNILIVDNVHTYIGDFYILQGVSIRVKQNEITAVLGRNGAGKTTLLRTIIGFYKPRTGKVIFKGKDITGVPTHKIAKLGISYVPSERAIFKDLTVEENLKIAYYDPKEKFNERLEFIFELFPDLKRLYKHKGRNLSGGQQKMLAISCGLINDVSLLLLDEPSEGLSPKYVMELFETISNLSDRVAILIVEQNFSIVKKVANFGYLIDNGKIVASGPMNELSGNKELLLKYLGVWR